jgi:hypothetical protein
MFKEANNVYEILAKEELGTINKLMVIDAPLVARA